MTIGGTVSPAGGNFEEPVTQATLSVVGAFMVFLELVLMLDAILRSIL